jgi:hypothetical protein
MPKIELTLKAALDFYGLSTDDLYVQGKDEKEQPIYAHRIYPDRVVFVLAGGPKLAYPPKNEDQIQFLPVDKRADARKAARLPAQDDEDDQPKLKGKGKGK